MFSVTFVGGRHVFLPFFTPCDALLAIGAPCTCLAVSPFLHNLVLAGLVRTRGCYYSLMRYLMTCYCFRARACHCNKSSSYYVADDGQQPLASCRGSHVASSYFRGWLSNGNTVPLLAPTGLSLFDATIRALRSHATAILLQSKKLMTELVARLGCEVFASYGMSECCGKISMSLIDTETVAEDQALNYVTSSGRGFCMVDLRLVDSSGSDVTDGVGEVWCRGETLFRDGYCGNAESTDEKFFTGWFRTGDLASMDHSSGYISVVRICCLRAG